MEAVSEQFLWVERYRPQKVEDCILPEKTKTVVQQFVEKGSIPNLLLYGSAGTGKTTLAKALCNELGYEWLMINGSDEGRLIETLRTKIKNFASAVSFGGNRKCIILDEADYLSGDVVQPALRAFIEEYANNCNFILTCNFPNRIKDALHSRCTGVNFTIPNNEKASLSVAMLKRSTEILDKEGIDYEKRAVAELIKNHFPDFRRTINELQRYSVVGKIDTGILAQNDSAEIDDLIKMLKARSFTDVRKWIATNPNLDMGVLVRNLYDKVYTFSENDTIPSVVLTLAEYQYRHAFAIDAEVNIMAMLTQLMTEVEFKE
tara:strand:- start:5260 stop:6213 length:954 start_codon:yes stop_codon:yes gene_type:complete